MKIMASFGMMSDADAAPAITGAKGAPKRVPFHTMGSGLRFNCRAIFVVICVQAEIAAQLSHL